MATQHRADGSRQLPVYDLTARKAHQWAMIALVAAGFVVGGQSGALFLAIAGAIMLMGRFWWPADIVRQIVWRFVEPAGILQRHDAHEDRETRRVARTLGGIIWLVSAALVSVGLPLVAWLCAGLICLLVVLDATMNFCALCFIVSQIERRRRLPDRLQAH